MSFTVRTPGPMKTSSSISMLPVRIAPSMTRVRAPDRRVVHDEDAAPEDDVVRDRGSLRAPRRGRPTMTRAPIGRPGVEHGVRADDAARARGRAGRGLSGRDASCSRSSWAGGRGPRRRGSSTRRRPSTPGWTVTWWPSVDARAEARVRGDRGVAGRRDGRFARASSTSTLPVVRLVEAIEGDRLLEAGAASEVRGRPAEEPPDLRDVRDEVPGLLRLALGGERRELPARAGQPRAASSASSRNVVGASTPTFRISPRARRRDAAARRIASTQSST